MTERQALHAYLSQEAHAGWQDFAEDGGVSATSLCEVIGVDLGAAVLSGDVPFADLVKRARKIDAQRRRRG
jgi:hypothetical protein